MTQTGFLASNWAWTGGTLIAGFVAGLLYFHSLRWMTQAFVQGFQASAWGLLAVRVVAMAAFLIVAVRLGALPLLAALAGVLCGRFVVMRLSRKGRQDD
ncbi:MAG: hypothetical protein LBQ32_09310 [Burkholderiaceae bacterium]|jgi:hypothetical protein|nr:hypothetical protein [Burkholderiaceae bacterium]